MDEIITEKNYPIENIWLFKQISGALIILLALIIFNFLIGLSLSPFVINPQGLFLAFVFLILIFGIPIIMNVLRRSNFHYSLEEKIMILHQGIISKQNRNVPYGRIQGVFVNQSLFDRIFGLASLTIEDFSEGGISAMSVDGYVSSGKSRREALGFIGNKIHIPGLKKDDAEALREIILQKIKENPIEDSQSGL